MVIRFESKKDWTIPIIWGFLFIIYSTIAFTIYYIGGDISEIYALAYVWIGLGVFFYLLLKTTFYTVDQEHLVCHIIGFKKKIPLNEITKIETQKGLYAGLKINTAWKGLVVSYGKWDEILISPAQEQLFIETIKAKNPTLKA
ncbi:MAG: hypothetical protein RL365_2223 [Bacteroidota bacterium]